MRYLGIVITTIIILASVNIAIYRKEQLRTQGTVLLLELAPVDPRSLMQGDYMQLRYRIAEMVHTERRQGYLVVERDENQVAHFKAVYDGVTSLSPHQYLLRFRKRGLGTTYLGAESFFFQEGHAQLYQTAHYGELRVSPTGESILVGLRDAERKPLRPTAGE